MINREKKNVLMWLMLGLYFGTFLTKAFRNFAETGVWDWLLIMLGIAVIVIHYSPDKTIN